MSIDPPHPALEDALSLDRFGRYLAWASDDRSRAIELYTLNTRISESLYTPLQTLEVTLRNRIHMVMTEMHHENWFSDDQCILGSRQPEQLKKAIQDIQEQKKDPMPSRIVAELTFSFWTAMLGNDYENLWQSGLNKIAKREDGKGLIRKQLSGPLAPIRTLRNRIAHHEPIIMWDLAKHHANILQLTEWLSPAASKWCRENSRFDQVYPAERIVLAPIPKESEAP